MLERPTDSVIQDHRETCQRLAAAIAELHRRIVDLNETKRQIGVGIDRANSSAAWIERNAEGN